MDNETIKEMCFPAAIAVTIIVAGSLFMQHSRPSIERWHDTPAIAGTAIAKHCVEAGGFPGGFKMLRLLPMKVSVSCHKDGSPYTLYTASQTSPDSVVKVEVDYE